MSMTVACLSVLLALLSPADSRSGEDPQPSGGATLLIQVRARAPLPPPQTMAVDRDSGACGHTVTIPSAIVDPASRAVQNAAAWIDPPPVPQTARALSSTGTEPAESAAALTNRACRFEPLVLLARVGRPLEVRNDDAIMHNTNIAGPDRTFLNVAMPAGISPVAKTLKEPGIYPVRCDAHPFMAATVVSLDHAYAAATGRDGVARIAGLPAGQRTVTVWHATLGTLRRTVTVPAQGTMTVAFEFGE